jgi:hypothetical protein
MTHGRVLQKKKYRQVQSYCLDRLRWRTKSVSDESHEMGRRKAPGVYPEEWAPDAAYCRPIFLRMLLTPTRSRRLPCHEWEPQPDT